MSAFKAWLLKELYREHDQERDDEILHALVGIGFGIICLTAIIISSLDDPQPFPWSFTFFLTALVLLSFVRLVETLRDQREHLVSDIGAGILLLVLGIVHITGQLAVGLQGNMLIPIGLSVIEIVAGIVVVVHGLRRKSALCSESGHGPIEA